MCVVAGKFRAAKLTKMREALGQLAGITMLKQLLARMVKGELGERILIWHQVRPHHLEPLF